MQLTILADKGAQSVNIDRFAEQVHRTVGHFRSSA